MDIHETMPQDRAKEAAGLKALEFVKEGMVLGLGTGSTVRYFIEHLSKQCQKGLKVKAVATSLASEAMARRGGIVLLDANTVLQVDLTVDGADEIDPQKRMIKGAGGALVREKIIAQMSQVMVVIVDETKCVEKLGKCPLPVEVIPFGCSATQKHLKDKGFKSVLRKKKDGSTFVTDNHNWILDLSFSLPLQRPEEVEKIICSIAGVVDTGFFFHLAKKVIIGAQDGATYIRE